MRTGLVSLLAVVVGAALKVQAKASGWDVSMFKNLITFGDSYTDENRLNYFVSHQGKPPPAGTLLPEVQLGTVGQLVILNCLDFRCTRRGKNVGSVCDCKCGNYINVAESIFWMREKSMAASLTHPQQYTGSDQNGQWNPAMTLYDYAVSGAVVSNLETPRYFGGINAFLPDFKGYEVPAYLADKAFVNSSTGKAFFQPAITKTNSIASIFIGTNDVGLGAYLTDSQIPGNTLVSYIDKVYAQMDSIYASGIRYFVIYNLFPIYLAPLYANTSFGGGSPSVYWPNRPTNISETYFRMLETVTTVNEAYRVRTPYEVILQKRYPAAHIANFDVSSWALNVYEHPTAYLNGSLPVNVTGTAKMCENADCSNFTVSSSPDSFFWFDVLHPGEQTWRQLAREFLNILNGTSEYVKYYYHS